jgi:hypothetical protein
METTEMVLNSTNLKESSVLICNKNVGFKLEYTSNICKVYLRGDGDVDWVQLGGVQEVNIHADAETQTPEITIKIKGLKQ